jgi:sugar-specific transcriptional regulator TrmB
VTDDNNRLFQILVDFGLTEAQAKVFITAAQLGTPTVNEIAEVSNVRREEIYRLLPALEKMGLVEKLISKPMRIRTPDPSLSIARLIEQERSKAKKRISQLAKKSRVLLTSLREVSPDVLEEASAPEFSIINERESIRTALDELMKKSIKSIDILYSRHDLVWILSAHGEILQEAVARGVKIRTITEPPSGRDRLPKIIRRRFAAEEAVELKYIVGANAFYIIGDDAEVIIVATGVGHLPNANCLWTNSDALVALTHRDFEERWHESAHWKTVEGITIVVTPQGPVGDSMLPMHRLLVYRSPETKFNALFNFLKRRHDDGYMAVYVCTKGDAAEVERAMLDFGFEKETLEQGKTLRIMKWDAWLLKDGTFSIEKAIDVWDDLFFEAHDHGLKGFAAAVDMEFLFEKGFADQIEAYERELHNMLDSHMIVKCAYSEASILRYDEPLLFYSRMLSTHNTVLTEEHGVRLKKGPLK